MTKIQLSINWPFNNDGYYTVLPKEQHLYLNARVKVK